MRVLVIGCGSMGLFYAAKLTAGGLDVALACRNPEQVRLINEEGIVIHANYGKEVAKVSAIHVDNIPRAYYDIIVVAVKAYQVESVIDVISSAMPRYRDSLVVSIQNGIGPLELLEEKFGADKVAAAITYYGATKLSLNVVEFAGGNGIKLGQRGNQSKLLEVFSAALNRAGLNVELVTDIEAWRWDKLIVNASINPLTALLGVPNGYLLKSKYAKELIECIIGESIEVAKKHGIKLPRDPYKAVWSTIEATSSNRSSMLQDIEARRRTEIDYINGVIVNLGLRYEVPVPCNYSVYILVKALEEILEVKSS